MFGHANADIGIGGQEVQEAQGCGEIILRGGFIIQVRVVAALILEEGREVL